MNIFDIKNSYLLDKIRKIRPWQWVRGIFYLIIMIFSLAIIASSFKVGGWSMYVVKSGSMEPAIHTGSVVFDKKEADEIYVQGDIIIFQVPDSKDTVTHRIVEVKAENGITSYRTKGDANDAPDSDFVQKHQVVGRVIFSIPLIGYMVAFARTLPGLIIFIIIPAMIIIYEEIDKINLEIKKIKKAKKKTQKETKDIK